jgi:hypothetical protein
MWSGAEIIIGRLHQIKTLHIPTRTYHVNQICRFQTREAICHMNLVRGQPVTLPYALAFSLPNSRSSSQRTVLKWGRSNSRTKVMFQWDTAPRQSEIHHIYSHHSRCCWCVTAKEYCSISRMRTIALIHCNATSVIDFEHFLR